VPPPPLGPLDRKEFLKLMAAAAAGLVCAPWLPGQEPAADAAAPPKSLPKRRLGKDGPELTMLGLGGFHLGACADEKAARTLVDVALEEGIRFFDNAESYQSGKAERWMGAALEGRRDQVFLMSKTFALGDRSVESAKKHLAGTLERLRTDRLDLWQYHSVRDDADVDLGFREGGAMEFLLEQKRLGVIKHVGVTGHHRPSANLRALHWWDQGWKFDAMQLPINPIDFHQSSFQKQVLPELTKRGIGVIAMKTAAGGRLITDRLCTPDECLRYVWSLPVSVLVSGMTTPEEVRANAQRAREAAASPYSAESAEALLARLEPKAALELEWYKAKA